MLLLRILNDCSQYLSMSFSNVPQLTINHWYFSPKMICYSCKYNDNK